eukprot:102442-Amphidinium_carterae.1
METTLGAHDGLLKNSSERRCTEVCQTNRNSPRNNSADYQYTRSLECRLDSRVQLPQWEYQCIEKMFKDKGADI